MNTTSNILPESEQSAEVPAVSSPTHAFYWSVRREIWEFRSIYIVPLVVGAVFLLGYVFSLIQLPAKMRGLEPMKRHELLQGPYEFVALAMMAATFLVAIFYCLEALHGERRDRSILFWKSLPVSDVTTVLSKATVPIVILPLLTFATTLVVHCVMALLGSAVLAGSGVGASQLWSHVPLAHMWMMLLYHLVAIHALWYAPFYGWMLLVSAWARRAPLLWATVPVLAVFAVEKIAFNTTYLPRLLANRIGGGPEGVPLTTGSMGLGHSMAVLPLWQFMLSPGLWVGLAITAGFLLASARVRRNRGPV